MILGSFPYPSKSSVTFPPRVTRFGIVFQFYEHHNIPYVSQSTNNSLCNHAFTVINITNVWVLIIGRKEPIEVTKVMESTSIQQLTGKLNSIRVIKSHKENNIVKTNI